MIPARRLTDRIHDRLWTEVSARLTVPNPESLRSSTSGEETSISGSHSWVGVCREYSRGTIPSANFRRMIAVREIVETLGPVDGRHYARLINSWDPEILRSKAFLQIDSWGNPVRWPSTLLGTPSKCSPTSLRYLAHALWLKREGLVKPSGHIVEIGIGYGGLPAMNALISGASTLLVDLPEVSATAKKMLGETCLPEATNIGPPPVDYCVISNYAFTELSEELQKNYFESYLRASSCGVIVSNANVFAKQIGGRDDADLVRWFRNEGLNARLDNNSPIICPSDKQHRVSVIRW